MADSKSAGPVEWAQALKWSAYIISVVQIEKVIGSRMGPGFWNHGADIWSMVQIVKWWEWKYKREGSESYRLSCENLS